MNTTVVDAPPLQAPAPWLARLSRAQQLRLALGAIALIAVLLAAWMQSRQPDWRVLFSNLADKDGGAVVAQLSQMNVPYRHGEGGQTILVPADRVHDVRLRLASQGLPKGSVAGFELTESARFGTTQFQERLNFQRGLEGELTRSIQSLAAVQGARVHLALPAQNGFFREQQKASASVLVSLHPGRSLDRQQVAAIVHLVASSVPDLSPRQVSVIDGGGNLLSGPGEAPGMADLQQLQYVQNIERAHSQRIIDLLEPVVGRGNVKAQVSAEVDFSQTEATIEQHKPNQGSDAATVRSQQVMESSQGGGAPAGGMPGAVSNQPPGPSSAPINAPAAGAAAVAASAAASAQTRREQVTNFEVDKTVRVVRGAAGSVKRLNAAVVLNHRSAAAAGGKAGAATPLSAEEIDKITGLVREAIGFNKERGDSVQVMNAAFVNEQQPVPVLAWWQQPDIKDLARSALWPIGLLLMAMVIVFGLVRPALRSLQERAALTAQNPLALPGSQLSEVVADDVARPGLGASTPALGRPEVPAPPTAEQLRLEDARQLARHNPVAVANIVKTWVNGEAAG
ncbi:MAG: flagellar basal body M-ring protein FliF [Betaproteobacteria bacterium]|nr:flagellar basal body M-ring protein FliF [Betaproteobacteria bacterium]